MDGAQGRARLDSELVDQDSAGLAVQIQCVGLAAVSTESAHELADQVFVERPGGDGRNQFGDEICAAAPVQVDVHPIAEDLVVAFGQPTALRREVRPWQAGERLTPEQRERVPVLGGGCVELTGLAMTDGAARSGFEIGDVERSVSELQDITLRGAVEQFGGQRAAEAVDVGRKDLEAGAGWVVVPDQVEEFFRGADLVGAQSQDGKESLEPMSAHGDWFVAVEDSQWAEDLDA
ncbi:hypothetical protein GCM10009745_35080 [Kribbella yunnanensis]|uniref:Uncharacterized protein n=1 Tax=Kribbella yunnanensis TaxID=190194 RepID=A0ABP4TFI9_9ACTN